MWEEDDLQRETRDALADGHRRFPPRGFSHIPHLTSDLLSVSNWTPRSSPVNRLGELAVAWSSALD